MSATGADWVDEVLRFWFEECDERAWFSRDAAFDARLRERFGALNARLLDGLEPVPDTGEGLLAAVVVLDQFSRNLHRGDARAFAGDERARALAAEAIARGFDAGWPAPRRLFLYLPFEHSENLVDQDRGVALVAALGNPQWLQFAQAHRDLIARFGRFPHRNAVLGRESTDEERAAMAGPMGKF